MNPVSSKTAMYCFLDRTVAEYIKCLFSSTKDLQKLKLADLVERINGDLELIKDFFNEYMTERNMKKSLDIIDKRLWNLDRAFSATRKKVFFDRFFKRTTLRCYPYAAAGQLFKDSGRNYPVR